MSDLSEHFAFGPEDGVEERGYVLKAWQPANERARRVAVVQAFRDGELFAEIEVPMMHTNVFGVDVEDVASIERATDELMGGLP